MAGYYPEGRRYSNGHNSSMRSPTSTRSNYFGYEGRGERTHSADHPSSSLNHNQWNQWNQSTYRDTAGGGGFDPESRGYRSPPPPLHRSSTHNNSSTATGVIRSSPHSPTHPDPHRYSTHPSDEHPLLSPTRSHYPSSSYPSHTTESRVRRTSLSSAAIPMNGTLSPEAKHAPIPPPPTMDDQYASNSRNGAMSISSLLTSETPSSPPPRHHNIQLTASSSRPQRRKPSVDIPPPSLSSPAPKKRKREGDLDDTSSRSATATNGKIPKIKFKSTEMDSMNDMTEESDGLDDAEFIDEHERYLEFCNARAAELIRQEEERQSQIRNVINDVFTRRLETRMKQSRHKAFQYHYEAAMSKVLREEARRKEEARAAKRNKKRKLLPVVEDQPIPKSDRRKSGKSSKSGKQKVSSHANVPDDDGEGKHSGFVIKLKGVRTEEGIEEEEEYETGTRRHSFLAGRPTPRYLPQLPPGEHLTPSELRAYDRIAKSAEKRFDAFVAGIWKDIAKKDIPKAFRQMDTSLKVKQSNAKKTAQLAAKEARRWQARSTKASKEMSIKSKKTMREMLVFWRKNEKEERDLRKKAEKEAIDRAKREEELREARRQARKLNFLITQTELYSHFVGKKVNAGVDEQTETTTGAIPQPSPIPSGSAGQAPSKFDELDFDADDDEALNAAAARSAQNAVQLAQNKAKDFDAATRNQTGSAGDIDMKDIDIDAEDLNFTNPTGLSDIDQIPQPKMLCCQLKEYQLKGLNWLVNLYEQGINGILADEMGLGKTVQSISVMAYLAETHNVWGPFLVIAPASTLHNWQQEITRFVPGLKALPYWGNAKDRKVLRKFWNRKHVTYTQDAPFHVLITSYQLVVQDEKYFQKIKWQYMILDEAQAIKSSSSSRWKILLGLHCRNRLLLTGTPIQNTMQELWALLHFIMPTLFDSHEEFSEWFSKDIESHTQSNTKLNQQQLRRLHMILKPFMLRRNKRDVQSELPAKVELDIYCNLSYRQRAFYKTLRERISIGDLLERAMSGEAKGDESLMNLVMQFRKVCNHPDLFERADVRSPLAFSSFGATNNIAREGPQLSLAYTTRSRITYEVPKLIYREGGLLSVPGEDSEAGNRRKLLDNLMNIWQADYIEEAAQQNNSTFSFLRFVDTSAGEATKTFRGHDVSAALDSINRIQHRVVSEAVYDDGTGYNQAASMLLIPGATNRYPLRDVTNERVMDHLCNVAEQTFKEERLHIMDPMYDAPVFAPPVDIECSDRTFYVEQNETLFDPISRRALFGILPLEECSLDESREIMDTGSIPPQGLLGSAMLERGGYSGIRVPEMHRFVTDSGKLATLDRLLAELKIGGHRVLLYFQMTRMMDLIEEYLTYRQYKYLRLDGSSKIGDRRDMVADWQTRSDLFVFVLSTRAGGLGINLTAADTVIFYDSDWNPTVDSQAMDRAHRLGQTKQVTVYRLITRGTIEERILLRAKQKEEVQRVVISGNAFKETEVDFNKGNARDVVSWLLDDDELEEQLRATQAKREAEEAEAIRTGKKKGRGGKKKLGIASLEGPAAARTLEDLYHEGEGNFEDASARASGTATPASGVEPGPLIKKRQKSGETHKAAVKRSQKRRSAAQAISYLDEGGDIEMTDA